MTLTRSSFIKVKKEQLEAGPEENLNSAGRRSALFGGREGSLMKEHRPSPINGWRWQSTKLR